MQDTLDEGQKAHIVKQFRETCECHHEKRAAELVAARFSVMPSEVLKWAQESNDGNMRGGR